MKIADIWKNIVDGDEVSKAEETEKKKLVEEIEEESQPAQEKVMENKVNTQTKVAEKSRGSASLELKVVRPESFASVGQIADHLMNGRTVVLNLEATSKEQSRRIVDFLTGVSYSINGDIKLVSANTYIITPDTVSMSGESVNTQEEAADADVENEAPSFGNF